MNIPKSEKLRAIALACSLYALTGNATAATSLSISLDNSRPGRTISQEFAGLSIEMADVCSAAPVFRYETKTAMTSTNWGKGCIFDKPGADEANEGLLGVGSGNAKTSSAAQAFQEKYNKMIKLMGVKNIRVGGTSADSIKERAYPPLQTAKNVIDFAKAVGLTELEWNLPVVGLNFSTTSAATLPIYDTKDPAQADVIGLSKNSTQTVTNNGIVTLNSDGKVVIDATFQTYVNYAVDLFKYRDEKYPELKLIFEIGNEDDAHGITYDAWVNAFEAYAKAIIKAIPADKRGKLYLTGPSTTGKTPWYSSMQSSPTFTSDAGTGENTTGWKSHIGYINIHEYQADNLSGACTGDVCATKAKALLGMPDWGAKSDRYKFVSTSYQVKLAPRLLEANSITSGGVEGVGDSYAAALWALTYMGDYAKTTNLAGLNLHVGSTNGGYSAITPPFATGTDPKNSSPTLKSVGYAILMFNQFLRNGQIIVPSTTGDMGGLSVYGAQQPDGRLYALIVNRNLPLGAGATVDKTVDATVSVPAGYTSTRTLSLTQSASNPAALDGITLGGARVGNDGTWEPNWSTGTVGVDNNFKISVDPLKATLIEFSAANQTGPIVLGDVGDSTVRDGSWASSNFGDDQISTVKTDVTGFNRVSYFKFDVSGISKKITSAQISLMPVFVGKEGFKNDIYAIDDNSWSERSITYNNAPLISGGALAQVTASKSNTPVTFDVSTLAAAAQEKNGGIFTIAVKSPVNIGALGGIDYATKESSTADFRPKLVIQRQ